MTRNELFEALKKDGVHPCTIGRLRKVSDKFGSLESFFSASEGDIMKAYSDSTPGGKKGLGGTFLNAYDKARFIYDRDRMETKEKKEMEEREMAEKQAKKRFLTATQVKTVSEFMELCSIDKIDIDSIYNFLGSIEFKQTQPEAVDSAQ